MLSLFVSGCPGQPRRMDDAHPVTNGLFDVGGHRLYLECAGTGTPTVVLEHGQGTSRATWDEVWPGLVASTRTCRYDRAGRGDSEPGPVPTTSARVVADLHTLLRTAHVAPPYLMVGHSLGGMNVQLYTHTFPAEVVGLVLVESSSRDYDPRTAGLGAPGDDPAEQQALAAFLGEYDGFMRDPSKSPEGLDWEASYRELAAVTDFGALPLRVLTAGDRSWTAPPSATPLLQQRLAALWLDAQTKLAARGRRSTHLVVEGAGHFVQKKRPAAVVEAVRSVLAAIAAGKG
jgi:pimeloyl-ACP methyl ester carboxylesterase